MTATPSIGNPVFTWIDRGTAVMANLPFTVGIQAEIAQGDTNQYSITFTPGGSDGRQGSRQQIPFIQKDTSSSTMLVAYDKISQPRTMKDTSVGVSVVIFRNNVKTDLKPSVEIQSYTNFDPKTTPDKMFTLITPYARTRAYDPTSPIDPAAAIEIQCTSAVRMPAGLGIDWFFGNPPFKGAGAFSDLGTNSSSSALSFSLDAVTPPTVISTNLGGTWVSETTTGQQMSLAAFFTSAAPVSNHSTVDPAHAGKSVLWVGVDTDYTTYDAPILASVGFDGNVDLHLGQTTIYADIDLNQIDKNPQGNFWACINNNPILTSFSDLQFIQSPIAIPTYLLMLNEDSNSNTLQFYTQDNHGSFKSSFTVSFAVKGYLIPQPDPTKNRQYAAPSLTPALQPSTGPLFVTYNYLVDNNGITIFVPQIGSVQPEDVFVNVYWNGYLNRGQQFDAEQKLAMTTMAVDSGYTASVSFADLMGYGPNTNQQSGTISFEYYNTAGASPIYSQVTTYQLDTSV